MLIERCIIPLSLLLQVNQITRSDKITYHNPVLSSFMTYYRICISCNKMGATSGARTAQPCGEHQFTLVFISGVRIAI